MNFECLLNIYFVLDFWSIWVYINYKIFFLGLVIIFVLEFSFILVNLSRLEKLIINILFL